MLRQDRCLARYLLWRTLLQASRSAHAFLVVFALVRFSLGDRATGLFILAAEGSRLLAGVPCGWVTDHLGPRRGIVVVSCFSLMLAGIAVATAWVTPAVAMAYVLFLLFGVFKAMWFSADSAMVLSLTTPDRHLRYVSLALLVPLPVTLAAPVVTGYVAGRFGYAWAFMLSAALALAALIVAVSFRPSHPTEPTR